MRLHPAAFGAVGESGLKLLASMVHRLVDDGCIRTLSVERAFRKIERHRFVPEVDEDTVYAGEAIPIKHDERGVVISSSSEPGIMPVMIEQLSLEQGSRVLEVGTGSGYNAALLAELAGPDGQVTTIDLDEDLVEAARRALAGLARVTPLAGDGWDGAPEQAPFDRIEVTVGVWDLSPRWIEQLGEGGVIVAPLWLRAGVQASVAFRKHADRLVSESVRPCGFMRLRGPHAGPEALVAVDGWIACVDGVRTTDTETLRVLLATEPHVEEIPTPPEGWFERLVLEEHRAIRLFTSEEPWRDACGLFFADEEASLAVVEGSSLLSYGHDPALERVREELTHSRAVRLEEFYVEAIRAGRRAAGRWVLRRPEFTYAVACRDAD